MTSPLQEPIAFSACQLTPSGRGAVATIEIRGAISVLDQHFCAASGSRLEELAIGRISFGFWGSPPAREEVVLVRTAMKAAEVHCHGGLAAVDRILRDLTDSGGRLCSPAEWLHPLDTDWTEQARAECQRALTRAATQKTAHHLLRQCTLFPEAVAAFQSQPAEVRKEHAATMLRWSRFGRHLTRPWRVVLCGRPNVGKSSLINALVGYTRSIVFDQPGTTRDIVAVETAFSGWPVELSDTAGIRHLAATEDAADRLESAGIARTRVHLQEADVVVLVVEAAGGFTSEDHEILAAFPEILVVRNKLDLAPGLASSNRVICCSAKTGEGLPELMNAIVGRIVPEEPDEETPFPVTERQVAWLKQCLVDGICR